MYSFVPDFFRLAYFHTSVMLLHVSVFISSPLLLGLFYKWNPLVRKKNISVSSKRKEEQVWENLMSIHKKKIEHTNTCFIFISFCFSLLVTLFCLLTKFPKDSSQI